MVAYNNSAFNIIHLFELKEINQILQYLSGKDWINLLVTCKSWNEVILQAMWERMSPIDYYEDPKGARNSYIKYGHLIKCLDFTPDIELPPNMLLYPNATNLIINLSYYLKNWYNFDNLLIDGLVYDDYIDDFTMEEYMFINEVYYEPFFNNLRYLKVNSVDEFFKNNVSSILPQSITTLKVKNSSSSATYLLELLDRLKLLKQLNISYIKFTSEEYELFKMKSLLSLKSLKIKHLRLPEHSEIVIDSSLLPKLNKLELKGYESLKFIGVNNITQLKLERVDLVKTCFDPIHFPCLNKLNIKYCYNLLAKHFYSILDMTKLTYFTYKASSYSLLLLEEVYPNKPNNLIYLKLDGLTLGYAFLNYFNKFCLNVENLILEDNSYNFDFLILNARMRNISHKLKDVMVKNYDVSTGSRKMSEYLLDLFQDISVIKLPKVEILSPNFIKRYFHKIKLLD